MSKLASNGGRPQRVLERRAQEREKALAESVRERDLRMREADLREQRFNSVIDKQYALYAWNNGKLQALATVNGLLVAAAGFLFRAGPRDNVAAIAMLGAIGFLFLSTVICLRPLSTFPQSGRTLAPWRNLRSSDGIRKFAKWQEYLEEFASADRQRYLADSARQAFGMVFNARDIHHLLERAVRVTIVGVAILLVATFFQFRNTWDGMLASNPPVPPSPPLNVSNPAPQRELTVQEQLQAPTAASPSTAGGQQTVSP